MKRFPRLVTAFVFVVGVILASARGVLATCHSFKVTVSPETVAEGSSVTVTIERNAGLSPSSVQVISVEENATSGADYEKVDRRIDFTTETREAFAVATKDDSVPEATESFLLRASNASGCPIKPEDFRYGNAVRVTIQDNDSISGPDRVHPTNGRVTENPSSASTSSATNSLSPTPKESDGALSISSDFSPTYLPAAFPFALTPATGNHPSKWIIAAVLLLTTVGVGTTAWWIWSRKVMSP